MALIYIYDATEIDRQQISDGLKETDHRWEFVDDSISLENINPDAEVISVFVSSKVTSDIIDALPKLKLIACRSTGFNNIDLVTANQRGVAVENVPTYGEQTVAEYAFTLLLALSRRLNEAVESFDENTETELMRGWDLNGKTLGVIGTGHIGRCSIKIANGFGMNIIAYDPFPNEEASKNLGFSYVDLDELLKNSDAITLHAPYVPGNHHLINEEKLALMKPSAVIINTARGELIDTKALTEALAQNQIAGAALDVIEGEQLFDLDEEMAILRRTPIVGSEILENSLELMALHKMPNVIITPHNAFNTAEAIGRINSVTCENIIKFWYGETPNSVKNPTLPIGKLVLVRHTESKWNATGKWTGVTDTHLSDEGFHAAALLGQEIVKNDLKFDKSYCSNQIRTLETLQAILDVSGQIDVPFEKSSAINERDYGDYTGKNKWEMRDLIGDEKFQKVRRGWNEEIPNGETLKQVYERAVPFYKEVVLPQLLEGKNILIVSHGNSIRAITKYIESLSDEDIEKLEMIFNTIIVYQVDKDGKMTDKKIYHTEAKVPANA